MLGTVGTVPTSCIRPHICTALGGGQIWVPELRPHRGLRRRRARCLPRVQCPHPARPLRWVLARLRMLYRRQVLHQHLRRQVRRPRLLSAPAPEEHVNWHPNFANGVFGTSIVYGTGIGRAARMAAAKCRRHPDLFATSTTRAQSEYSSRSRRPIRTHRFWGSSRPWLLLRVWPSSLGAKQTMYVRCE